MLSISKLSMNLLTTLYLSLFFSSPIGVERICSSLLGYFNKILLKRAGAPEGVRIVGVECLSACNTGCAVSLTKPGAWSYVYGRLPLDDVPAILEGAGKYAASADGIVPWRDRPTVFRKQSIARIPPHPPHEEAAE